ncbi:MAG: LysM peptidoglycan-binding domain-containing protein [Bacteroidota bacterium]
MKRIMLMLLGVLSMMSGLKAQESIITDPFIPDTSLTYTTFLRQCQEFTSIEENRLWVINFWASYNTASLSTLPELKILHDTYREKPVRFVSISVDKNRLAWENAILRNKLTWEQLFLPNDASYGFLRKAFKHRSFPALFLVHLDGRIQRMVSVAEMEQELSILTNSLPDEDEFPDFEDEPEEPDEVILYEVKKGDTLYGISREYDVKWQDIQKLNKLSSTSIKEGQILKIPSK